MWKKWGVILGLFVAGLFLPGGVRGQSELVPVYVFWGEGCPHCADLKEYLETVDWEEEGVEVKLLEIYKNRQNLGLMKDVGQELGEEGGGVPFSVVGDRVLVGYMDGVTGRLLDGLIDECRQGECEDVVGELVVGRRGVVMEEVEMGKEVVDDVGVVGVSGREDGLGVEIPLVGKVDVANWSLPLLTVVLGLLDGFNPCAMWVLVFLIGLLLSMEDVRRRWILGLAFIGATGVVYVLFLTAWLNFFLVVGWLWWVRLLIGLVAIGSGVYHLKEYYEKTTKCKVIDPEKRKKIFGRLEKITRSQSLGVALVGIVLLAFSVNVVELVCSAGLPAIFSQTLSLAELSWWKYGGYILLYVSMFVADDVVVFVGAMKAMQVMGTNDKYVRWSNLVGGVVIGLLGVLLIFKPEWLMGG